MENLKRKLFRKSIHFLGTFYFLLYAYYGRFVTLEIVATLTFFSILIEILRRRFTIVPDWILDPYEIKGVGAHLYFGFAALVLTALLSPEAAVTGVIVGSIGDGVAGLIKAYQKDRLKEGLKEGLLNSKKIPLIGMFLTSFLFLILISYLNIGNVNFDFDLRIIALSCLVGAIIESKPIKIKEIYINDNFSVPLFAGVFYHLLS